MSHPLCIRPLLPDLDDAPATEILSFALDRFRGSITVACSMQDAVVVDLATRIDPSVEVFFLDTGFHFTQTWDTAAEIVARHDLNLVVLSPPAGAPRWDVEGTDACCAARKVGPLEEYLATKDAWVSGLRRADGAGRTATRAVEWDDARGIVKVNPLVSWSDDEVGAYVDAHGIVVNPLRKAGYDSIGCAPCTMPGAGRDGRWSGTGRTECGLHGRSA